MIISYFGKQFFKVQYGDTVVAFNPISKDSKTGKPSRFGADIVLQSANHPDYNGLEMVSHGEREPFKITSPGDYEIGGLFVKGIIDPSMRDGKAYINTIFTLSIDNIAIGFLGALSNEKLSSEAREAMGDLDIVFVPLGENETVSSSTAYKIAVSLEPKLIIPMDFSEAELNTFLKEGGQEKTDKLDKLTIKRKDLEGKQGEIIVLAS